MKFRAFKYFFREGFKNVWTNGLVSITSIFTVMASLIVLALFLIVTLNVNNLVKQVRDQYEIVVYLKSDIDQTKISQVGDELDKLEGIESFELVTKDQAFTNMKEEMFSDKPELVEGVDNFLDNSYNVRLSDLGNANAVEEKIAAIDGVDRGRSSKDVEDKLLHISRIVNMVSFWMYLLLTVVSISIITNTIRIAVFARRKEINIMKYIGATNWFIRWPFIIEGMIIGLIASAISFGVAFLGYHYTLNYITNALGNEFVGFQFVGKGQMMGLLAVILLIVGPLIGTIGSGISVRKHLKV